jgi:hypothetical protein
VPIDQWSDLVNSLHHQNMGLDWKDHQPAGWQAGARPDAAPGQGRSAGGKPLCRRPPQQDLATLTAREWQDICRRHGFRGWSKLRRSDLIAFLQERLGTEPEASASPAPSYPHDANRIERLLLLLLGQLRTATEAIDDAWRLPENPNR